MIIISEFGHWLYGVVFGWGGIAAVVALIAGLLWYFTPPFLSDSKAILLQIAIGAAVFAFVSTYFYTNGYRAGYAVAINQVAAKNKEASDAVKEAISKVDACNAANGVWDTVSGLCQR